VPLPTIDQIETYAGDFERALAIAGLELPPKRAFGKPLGVPIVEAAIRFYEITDRYLPTTRQLIRFAREHHFALASKDSGRPWREYLAEVEAELARRGVPPARLYRPRQDKASWQSPAENPWPDEHAYQSKTFFPTLASVIVPVSEFLAHCRAERRAADWRYYKQLKKARPAWPSHEALKKYGGFRVVKEHARKPHQLERARRELAPTNAELERRTREQGERRLEHVTAHSLCAYAHLIPLSN